MPDSQVDEIKSRLDLAELIRGYMKLEKSGANLRGLCVFHKEKTPSFFVSPPRQLWRCFGCGVGGDMFTFIQQIEGVDFKGALEILADKAGVQLKSYDPKIRSEKSRLYEVCEKACQFFERQLAATALGQLAKQYLLDRGISHESIEKFRLGFSPNTRSALTDFLRGQGFSPSEIFKAGVSIQTTTDRFRGRIMFPIFDVSTQVIGFGGRIFFPKNQVPDKNLAKYINIPQTILYDKSKVLYGLDRAKSKIREQGSCILMEGYTDVIMAHQAGSENAAGVSGTALTEQQLDLVRRYTENITTCFDMDIAGDNATKRGIEIAQRKGFNIKVALLPKGKDPAELIQKDKEVWKKSIEKTLSIGDFYFSTTFSKFDKKTPEGRKSISNIILSMIKQIPARIEQSFWVQRLASEFTCTEHVIWADLQKIPDSPRAGVPAQDEAPKPQRKTKHEMLCERLILLLHQEPRCQELINEKDLSFMSNKLPLGSLLMKTCAAGDRAQLSKSLSPEEHDLLNTVLFQEEIFPMFDGSSDLIEEFKLCVQSLKEIALKEKLSELQTRLRQTPGDKALLEKFQKTSNELIQL